MLCDGPSEACAPVVPDNGRLTCAAMTYETEHVVHQLLDPVVFDPARFCAQVITAQVGRDDAEVLTERRQLMPPRVPTLREAMQQHDQTLARAALDIVQTHVAHLRVAVAKDWLTDLLFRVHELCITHLIPTHALLRPAH